MRFVGRVWPSLSSERVYLRERSGALVRVFADACGDRSWSVYALNQESGILELAADLVEILSVHAHQVGQVNIAQTASYVSIAFL